MKHRHYSKSTIVMLLLVLIVIPGNTGAQQEEMQLPVLLSTGLPATDTPEELLAAPRPFPAKARFLSSLRKEMANRGSWQGRLSADSDLDAVSATRRRFS